MANTIESKPNADGTKNNGEGEKNLELDDKGGEGENNGADDGEGEGDKAPDNSKPQETDEARLARLHRQTNQARKKAGLDPIDFDAKPVPKKKGEKKSESGELDYGQKAFLVASGIKTAEEIAFTQQVMTETGRSLEEVIGSKYFQAELAEMREFAETKKATPTGKNRSGNPSATDTVEYWIKAGKLPPMENTELRRKVVNAKIAAEKTVNVFSPDPVVGNV